MIYTDGFIEILDQASKNTNIIKHDLFDFVEGGSPGWTITYYSKEINTIVCLITKNASSTMEGLFDRPHEYPLPAHFPKFVEVDWNDNDVFDTNMPDPKLVVFLRDPIQRAKSGIRQAIDQLRYFGATCTVENFKDLSRCEDRHLCPQAVAIPLWHGQRAMQPTASIENMQIDISRPDLSLYKDGWPSLLDHLKIDERLSDKNKYFWVSENPNRNVVCDFITWLGFGEYITNDDVVGRKNNRGPENYKSTIILTPEHEAYLKQYYRMDYKIINSVKFENEKD